MYKNIFSLIIAVFVSIMAVSCSNTAEKNKGLTVSGEVKNPQSEGSVTLQRYGEAEVMNVATFEVRQDNTFEQSFEELEPGFYRLNFYDTQFVNLILDDEDVHVVADGDAPTGNVEITGSTEMDYVTKMKSIMQEYQQEINQINSEYAQSNMNQDEAQMEQIYGRLMEIQKKYSQKIKNEVNDMGASLAALQAVSYLDPDQDFEFMDSIATKLQNAYPNSQDVQQFAQQIENVRKVSIGNEPPNFTLPNPEGDSISLASFEGDYVLVDFWAAWCKPCRMENPNLVEAYKKYNDQGFEIFGVSLDRNDEDWTEAIEKDGLTWKQVRDVNNKVAQEYNVSAIPMNFLLDKDGKIIGKNLRGQALEARLKEIFG
ncbi:MAG: peroxiredoxin family protein [Candidatus Cyclobacteriaceae bacterium M3_2C_046]